LFLTRFLAGIPTPRPDAPPYTTTVPQSNRQRGASSRNRKKIVCGIDREDGLSGLLTLTGRGGGGRRVFQFRLYHLTE
jgi:hypothetical protein